MLFPHIGQVDAVDPAKAATLLRQAEAALEHDEIDAALSFAYIALDEYNRTTDADGLGRAEVLAGNVLLRLKHYDTSAQHYEHAASHLKLPAERAKAFVKLAEVRVQQGKYEDAIDAYQKVRQLNRRLGDMERLVDTTYQLAYLNYEVSHWAEAERYYTKTLQLLNGKVSDRKAVVLFELGNTVAQQGRFQEARTLFEQCLAQLPMLNLHLRADALHGLALTYIATGNRRQASVRLRESLHLKRQMGEQQCVADALYDLAVNEAALGRLQAARPLLEEALILYEQLNAPQAHLVRKVLSQQHIPSSLSGEPLPLLTALKAAS